MASSRCWWCIIFWLGILLNGALHYGLLVMGSSDLCGRNFVFAFPPNLDPGKNVFELVLTPCDANVNGRTIVNINTPSAHQHNYSSTHVMTSQNGGGLTVVLPQEIATERDEFFIEGTIHIASDRDITVVAVSGQERTIATFPVIPTVSLGYEYVIVSYANPNQTNTLPAEFVVSSIHHAKTQVRLQLTGDALPSTDWSVPYPATEEFSIDLFSYDSVLFRSNDGLTGSRIWSDHPVSVVSGSACIFIPRDVLACDHIVEHIPPVNRLGRRHIIPPFLGRHSGYVYRVVASRHSTRVTMATYSTDVKINTVTLHEGEFFEMNIESENASLIVSDKPVLVAQFSKRNFTDGIGDPAMMIITPIEQYVDAVSFTNFNVSIYEIANEYLTIISLCDQVRDLRLNGAPLEEESDNSLTFQTMDDFCILRKQLFRHDVYTITSVAHEARFGAFQYGFGIRVAYAHPVGFGLRELTCRNVHGEEEPCAPPDTTPPILSCPNNVTLYAHRGDIPTVSWIQPIAVDDSDDVIKVTSDHESGDVFPVGMTRVTYEAVDLAGNTAHCSFYVTVNAVDVYCPDDQKVSADIGSSSTTVTWEYPTTEGDNTRLMTSSNYESGDRFSLGVTTVTYTTRDQANAVITDCSFLITVLDDEPPVIHCPDDADVFTEYGQIETAVYWNAPSVLDNSGQVIGMNLSHVPGNSLFIGRTPVTYTVWDEANNAGKCTFYVTVSARCPPDLIEELSWPATAAGETADSNQRCPIDTQKRGYGLAMRHCSPDISIGARWQNPQRQSCGVSTTEIQLKDLQKTPVVDDNVQDVVNALVEVSETNDVTVDTVTAIAETLTNIVNVESSSTEVTDSVIEVIDNFISSIIETPSLETPEADDKSNELTSDSSSDILLSLENQVSLSLQAGHQVRSVKPNIAVEGVQLMPNSTDGDLSFAVLRSDDPTNFLEDDNVQVFNNASYIPSGKVETSIKLPATFLKTVQKDNIQVSFMVFQDDVLFPSATINNGSHRIAGSIISAAVEGVSVQNLSDPVVIEFVPTKISERNFEFNSTTTGCYFYDKIQRDWSSDGCESIWSDDDTGDVIVCHCNHLTNFAVIVDLAGQSGIENEKLVFVLDVISKLGCVLSLIGLTVTLAIFLVFRRLRLHRPRQLLIHFCFSLFFLYLIFLAGIDASKSSAAGCTFVAALLHYLTLTTIAWMGVEARNMYVTLVKVFDAEAPNFMAWACVAAWGMPLLVVVITLSSAFHQYRNVEYCFLSPGPSLYFGLILPICVVLLHNFIMFGLVMHRLLRSNLGGTIKEKSRFHQLNMRLQNAVAISVLLGITWIFGFLAIDEATFAFQLLFCLFNAFQGVIVFLLFCLRQEDVRKTMAPYFAWTAKYCRCWRIPKWSAVPTRVTAAASSNDEAARGRDTASPTTNDHDSSAIDMASTTDMSLSEVRTPLR